MLRKSAVAAAVIAFATAGSAFLGGTAFAGDETEVWNVGGAGGNGGNANANCLIPIGASVGLLGQGGNVAQCNAAGGAGGAGGTGANY
jgi:hypothetical protein